MTEQPEYRVGDEERQEAAARLETHFKAGRLDADEYEDRRGKALDAITRSDLDGLFTDLPEQPTSAVAVPATAPAGRRRRTRDTIMALLPFVALFLFFRTGQWMWFLVIPVAGILLYGPSSRRPGRDGDRDDRP